MTEQKMISIWNSEETEVARSALPKLGSLASQTSKVAAETLRYNIVDFIQNFNVLFENQNELNSTYEIDQVELNMAINGEGGVELVGKLSGSATASIKVIMKRKISCPGNSLADE